jgi:chorismate dehydratase
VLARLLLQAIGGASPRLEPLPIGEGLASTNADAVLLIGDRAMYPQREAFVEVWDLGERWWEWTGLPFVFAVWAARPGVDITLLESELIGARDRGVRDLAHVAHRESKAMSLDEPTCLEYLRENLHFYLGERERTGLKRFRELAEEHGLITPRVQRCLHDFAIG